MELFRYPGCCEAPAFYQWVRWFGLTEARSQAFRSEGEARLALIDNHLVWTLS